jgi:ribosomal protein L14E/L6E/L27E
MKPIEIGSVVLSRAGRDKGRFFIVVEIVDDQFVKITDGDIRRLATPKLKKIKHLKGTGDILEGIAEKLKNSVKVYDAEIYSALRKL